MSTLHVTNGDSAAQGLARSGLSGDVLPWRDVLHDGPVPTDHDREAFYATRALFLTERRWGQADEVAADFASRDARLDAVLATDDVVLWFEPDLYDQLQLVQVLSRLQSRRLIDRPRVRIVPADVMLGPLDPAQFLPLHELRRPIGADDLERGRAAWDAFTSASPDDLERLVGALDGEIAARAYAADPLVRLPHLTAALRRMLEEYPDTETGLSRSERQILQALADGPSTMGDLFQSSHGPREAWAWLGDWSFAWYVQRLSMTATPLIMQVDGSVVRASMDDVTAHDFWTRTVQLTAFGLDVLQGRANAIAVNAIDRWIGGVRLSASRHWRWNRASQRLQRADDMDGRATRSGA